MLVGDRTTEVETNTLCLDAFVFPVAASFIDEYVCDSATWTTILCKVASLYYEYAPRNWTGWERCVLLNPLMQRPDCVAMPNSSQPHTFFWPRDLVRLATRDEILEYALTK